MSQIPLKCPMHCLVRGRNIVYSYGLSISLRAFAYVSDPYHSAYLRFTSARSAHALGTPRLQRPGSCQPCLRLFDPRRSPRAARYRGSCPARIQSYFDRRLAGAGHARRQRRPRQLVADRRCRAHLISSFRSTRLPIPQLPNATTRPISGGSLRLGAVRYPYPHWAATTAMPSSNERGRYPSSCRALPITKPVRAGRRAGCEKVLASAFSIRLLSRPK